MTAPSPARTSRALAQSQAFASESGERAKPLYWSRIRPDGHGWPGSPPVWPISSLPLPQKFRPELGFHLQQPVDIGIVSLHRDKKRGNTGQVAPQIDHR